MTLLRRDLLSRVTAAGTLGLTGIRRAGASEATTGQPKRGGTLRLPLPESPANVSILESGTTSVIVPMMGVFNNLVVFDQHIARNTMDTIVPDLATTWAWSDGGRKLTFTLRPGVRWHDGMPFTAADVVHTWDLIQGRAAEPLRIEARRSWFVNVEKVTAQGDHEVTFHLQRPQPGLLPMIASGDTPIYPRHVPARIMRTAPIGTGPFRFVEYKPGGGLRVVRNPDYWKPDRPFLDGIEYTVVTNRATALLGFVSDKFDMTFPSTVTIPLSRDLLAQVPDAVLHMGPTNSYSNVNMNHTAPPFDNPQLRLAVAWAIDRGDFNRILTEGRAAIGGAMLPPPAGAWGLPPEQLASLPGYGPDVAANRARAREIMTSLGYGPDNRLTITLSTRNLSNYQDPSIILIDQLKHIWIDATLETVDAAVWVPKMIKKNYTMILTQSASAIDDPDQQFFESYTCDSVRNWPGFCDRDLEQLYIAQSIEMDQERRRQLVWDIDKRLQSVAARPVLIHNIAGTCWHPWVKGLTIMVNSEFNGWRMEDVWLDRA